MLLLPGCKKQQDMIAPLTIQAVPSFITYNILQGQHYSDKSSIRIFNGTEMNFRVRFDSSAIYKTMDPVNQYDINKLFGFSDGDNHHKNSARIGWGWNKNVLRLYAYVYSDSLRLMKEISPVAIGREIWCSILVSRGEYLFTVDETRVALHRAVETPAAAGYWLYPYFGGDEVAPHNISIYMKEEKAISGH